MSPTRTVTQNGAGERPLSPRSAVSQGQRSRVTQKTNHTNYPPLPESVIENDIPQSPVQRSPSPPGAPPSRMHTKSPSIAPSDSMSQVKSRFNRPQTREPPPRPAKSMKSVTEVDETPFAESVEAADAARYAASQRDGWWCSIFRLQNLSADILIL